jgi:ABC-type uncharacterized transport system ATPase subunit
LPDLAAVQYLPTKALPPLKRQMLGIGVGLVQIPDVLIVVAPAEGFTSEEKAILLRRLTELAQTQKISIAVLSKPQRILIDQSAATWINQKRFS